MSGLANASRGGRGYFDGSRLFNSLPVTLVVWGRRRGIFNSR